LPPTAPSRPPRISLIIPTLGRLAILGRVLKQLEQQSATEFEVVVVADAEHQQVPELDQLLRSRRFPARRLSAGLPGASAARNTGWRAARAPLLLFIDDDIVPKASLVEEHLRWHERHPGPEIGVLGSVRWAAELEVTPFMRWLEQGIQFDYPTIERNGAVWGNFYTANVSVKRQLVDRVGGFDQARLPFGYEDLDLALRMHREAGFRLLYNPAAAAEHVHPMDLEFWQRRVARIAFSERRFVELHPDIPAYFHIMFSAAAGQPPVGRPRERLLNLVPRSVPVVGPRLWSRADAFYRQRLAGPFLAAWEAAGGPQPSSAPEASISSSGSEPAGP
jgi:GT2 family glycosyltransferase